MLLRLAVYLLVAERVRVAVRCVSLVTFDKPFILLVFGGGVWALVAWGGVGLFKDDWLQVIQRVGLAGVSVAAHLWPGGLQVQLFRKVQVASSVFVHFVGWFGYSGGFKNN